MEELTIGIKGNMLFDGKPKALKIFMIAGIGLAIGAGILLYYGGNWFNYYWVFYGIFIGAECYLNLKGKSLRQYLGRTYFRLNRERLCYRPLLLRKEKCMEWEEVEKVTFLSSRILFYSSAGEKLEVDFKRFNYLEVQEVKEAICKMAQEMGIQVV